MKKNLLLTAFAALCCYLLAACGRDNTPAPADGKTYIRMKVDGRDWYDETVAVSGISVFDGQHNLSITGTNEHFEGAQSGLSIILSSDSGITEGTYIIGDFEGGATLTKVNGKTYLMTDGTAGASFTVTVTGIQTTGSVKRIKGTFSGTLAGPEPGETIEITDGAFVGY